MKRLTILIALLTFLVSFSIHAEIIRTWTSSDGAASFEGELQEFSETEVRIQRTADRNTFKLPLDKLSQADQDFVLELVAERKRDTAVKDGPYAEQITGQFEKATSKEGLKYQLFGNPKWRGKERYPIIIWLHGAGQSGSDNEAQMGRATQVFSSEAHQEEYPSFVLSPQCPSRDIGWKDTVETNLVTLIDDLAVNLPIDRNRIYVIGSSMGGFGSWRIAGNHPELFAAVVPICGGGRVDDADKLKEVPIWAFHGDQDEDVPVAKSREMVEAIKAVGGEKIEYTELAGEGHLIAGGVCVREDLAPWIYGQSKASGTE